MDLLAALDLALKSVDTIPREDVLDWIEKAQDLESLERLYRLTDEGYYRIQPELGTEITCGLIRRFLLECIRLDEGRGEPDADNGYIPTRYEAAWMLHEWYLLLLGMSEDTTKVLKSTSEQVTDYYLRSDSKIQDAIETGFLEHVLETDSLRPYFEHWAKDERLREAWERAMEWGKAHPDFMSGMIERLRKLEEGE